MSYQTSSIEPAEALEVLDGRAPVQFAEYVSSSRASARCVQPQAEAACERRGLPLSSARNENGEHGANRDLDEAARPGLCSRGVEPLGVASTASMLLDEVARREAAPRHAEVHRAARGDDADSELAGASISASTSLAPAGKT